MNWNFERNGGPSPEPGALPELCRQAYAFLAQLEPDWIGMPELPHVQTGPDTSPEEVAAARRRLHATEDILAGMRGFLGGMGEGNNPTGAFVRESTFTIGPQHHHRTGFHTPPTQIPLHLDEVPDAAIHSAVFRNSYCSPPDRLRETFKLTRLVDKVNAHNGRTAPWAACWLLGDTNEMPSPHGELVPAIDWSAPEITDDVHRLHRAEQLPDGSWRSYTNFDDIMLAAGMHDAARWAAHHGQLNAMAATAGRKRPDQGGPVRLDRGLMDSFSVQGVEYVCVIDMSGLSDHDLVVIDLSRRKLVEALLRQTIRPLAKWSDQPLLPMPTLLSRQQFLSMGPGQPLLVPPRVTLTA
ncbi:endonuclease/exonuclease/phosphatase family protein [Streptomyces umbrinus]|uniref:endonuclease/exonuclease/phosphatase family protein n=1 Tax=Streptomyces umbrinus TaxID=67370 RepID=UPI0027D85F35|nr:endonuclease/exonuclease/phosphatase family protein [Streptomyces umbrinus]